LALLREILPGVQAPALAFLVIALPQCLPRHPARLS
jgi:hypothetical protein